MKTLLLSKNDVEKVLNMKEIIQAVEEGYKTFQKGAVQVPQIVSVVMPEYEGESDVKSCYNPENKIFSVKIISGFYQNGKENHLPTMLGNLFLYDGTTGVPLCMMDGGLITGVRTGAAGAVSCKYLARKNSKTVAVIGGGGQARMQIYALKEIMPIETVRVYSPVKGETAKYKEDIEKETGLAVVVCETAEVAMQGADIAISTTPATKWLVKGNWVKPGMHIVAVGADMEGKNEWDPEVFKNAKIYNDCKAECMKRGETENALKAGIIQEDDIFAEIGEVITGKKEGRTNDEEITIFDTVGLGIQDNVTGFALYQKAKRGRLGSYFDFL